MRRASPGMTTAPCPGCGASPESKGRYWQREKDKVCRSCRRDLDRLAEMDRRAEQAMLTGGQVRMPVPWAPHALAYFPRDRDRTKGFDDSREGKDLQSLFHLLLIHGGDYEPYGEDRYGGIGNEEEEKNVVRLPRCTSGTSQSTSGHTVMPRERAELLVKLFKRIQWALQNNYVEGAEDGTRFLARLGAGEITLEDFADKKDRLRMNLNEEDA